MQILLLQAKVALEEFLNSKEAEEEEVHQMVLESLIGNIDFVIWNQCMK